MTDREAVERALAVLVGGARLPREPEVGQFVARHMSDGRPSNMMGQISRTVSEKAAHRAWRARQRIQAKFNAEMRRLVPVECVVCGESFMRRLIDQVRCRACLDAAKPRQRSGGAP